MEKRINFKFDNLIDRFDAQLDTVNESNNTRFSNKESGFNDSSSDTKRKINPINVKQNVEKCLDLTTAVAVPDVPTSINDQFSMNLTYKSTSTTNKKEVSSTVDTLDEIDNYMHEMSEIDNSNIFNDTNVSYDECDWDGECIFDYSDYKPDISENSADFSSEKVSMKETNLIKYKSKYDTENEYINDMISIYSSKDFNELEIVNSNIEKNLNDRVHNLCVSRKRISSSNVNNDDSWFSAYFADERSYTAVEAVTKEPLLDDGTFIRRIWDPGVTYKDPIDFLLL